MHHGTYGQKADPETLFQIHSDVMFVLSIGEMLLKQEKEPSQLVGFAECLYTVDTFGWPCYYWGDDFLPFTQGHTSLYPGSTDPLVRLGDGVFSSVHEAIYDRSWAVIFSFLTPLATEGGVNFLRHMYFRQSMPEVIRDLSDACSHTHNWIAEWNPPFDPIDESLFETRLRLEFGKTIATLPPSLDRTSSEATENQIPERAIFEALLRKDENETQGDVLKKTLKNTGFDVSLTKEDTDRLLARFRKWRRSIDARKSI